MKGPRAPRPALPPLGVLRERFHFDAQTGALTWRVARANKRPGDTAGHLSASGYRHVCVDYCLWLVHRIAWKMHYGTEPPSEIDHANGDRSDNRIVNLRETHRTHNNANQKVKRHSGTQVKGVFKRPHGYIVRVAKEHIGSFKTIEEAKAAYEKAARARFGAFFHDGSAR